MNIDSLSKASILLSCVHVFTPTSDKEGITE